MRLTSKGQVTILQYIRELARLKSLDEVEFCNKHIILRPPKRKQSLGEEAIATLRDSATANPGTSTDD